VAYKLQRSPLRFGSRSELQQALELRRHYCEEEAAAEPSAGSRFFILGTELATLPGPNIGGDCAAFDPATSLMVQLEEGRAGKPPELQAVGATNRPLSIADHPLLPPSRPRSAEELFLRGLSLAILRATRVRRSPDS